MLTRYSHARLQGFEWYSAGGGEHWTRLQRQVPFLADIGVTAMWLPPPTKGASTEGTGESAQNVL